MILDRPEEPGKKYALAFTILVHVALLAFLFFGVQWKRSKPEVMEVELWSPRPMPAQYVPPPPPPPEPVVKALPKVEPKPEPVVKKPEIVVKEEKKKPEPKKPEPKPEPPKPEPKKPEPKPEVKPPPKFDFGKELAQETANLKPRPNTQQLANAAAAEAEQRASSNKRGLADYATKIRVKVRGNIMLPPGIQGNPEAVFVVNQLPGGEVLDVTLRRSSGNPALDSAIERAIRKSSPLPKPDDPSLFKRELEIKYRPLEE
ncbi:MAG: energy transducer TonB [Ferribacterium limneticum]